jgi:hypothetical protein
MRENLSSTPFIMQSYATFIYISLNFNHWITLKHFGNHHNIINAFLVTTRSKFLSHFLYN